MPLTIGILAIVDPSSGGIYQYTESVLESLTSDNSGKYRYVILTLDSAKERVPKLGFEIRTLPISKIPKWLRMLRFFFLFLGIQTQLLMTAAERDTINDIDLFLSPVISPYPHYFSKKPFIFTLHDMQERYYPHFFSWRQRTIRRVLNYRLTQAAQHILCEAETVHDDIVRFLNVAPAKISVIVAPPQLSMTELSSTPDKMSSIRTKYTLPKQFLFYPSQFWPHKNHCSLIDALALLTHEFPDLCLVLTGGRKHCYSTLVAQVSRLRLTSRVIFTGFVDQSDLGTLVQLASVMVIPSLFESVSIPIFEAFAAKVPVCTGHNLHHQVGDAALCFDPLNPKDIANQIRLILTDSDRSKALTVQGHAMVSQLTGRQFQTNLTKIIDQSLPRKNI